MEIIKIIAAVAVFFVSREIWGWYIKTNEIVEIMAMLEALKPEILDLDNPVNDITPPSPPAPPAP